MSLVSVEANFRLRSRGNDIQEYNTINATLEQVRQLCNLWSMLIIPGCCEAYIHAILCD